MSPGKVYLPYKAPYQGTVKQKLTVLGICLTPVNGVGSCISTSLVYQNTQLQRKKSGLENKLGTLAQGWFLKTSAAEEGDRIAEPIQTFELRISTFSRSSGVFT